MKGQDKPRKTHNRDGKRPVAIHDEKIENGIDYYLVECRNPNIAWHWRPRNKIWGWHRLYDRFLYSERRRRQRRQIYHTNNHNGVGRNRRMHDYQQNLINYYNYHNYYNYRYNYYYNYYDYNYYDYEDPKYIEVEEHNQVQDTTSDETNLLKKKSVESQGSDDSNDNIKQIPQLHRGSGRPSSSSPHKRERQFHTHAWGTTECEEHSLTAFNSKHTSYNSSPPPRQKINEEFNRYYSPWENKHEFEFALNKLDRHYQNLFYSRYNESSVIYESPPNPYNIETNKHIVDNISSIVTNFFVGI